MHQTGWAQGNHGMVCWCYPVGSINRSAKIWNGKLDILIPSWVLFSTPEPSKLSVWWLHTKNKKFLAVKTSPLKTEVCWTLHFWIIYKSFLCFYFLFITCIRKAYSTEMIIHFGEKKNYYFTIKENKMLVHNSVWKKVRNIWKRW